MVVSRKKTCTGTVFKRRKNFLVSVVSRGEENALSMVNRRNNAMASLVSKMKNVLTRVCRRRKKCPISGQKGGKNALTCFRGQCLLSGHLIKKKVSREENALSVIRRRTMPPQWYL